MVCATARSAHITPPINSDSAGIVMRERGNPDVPFRRRKPARRDAARPRERAAGRQVLVNGVEKVMVNRTLMEGAAVAARYNPC